LGCINAEGYTATEIGVFRSLQDYVIAPPVFSALKVGESNMAETGIYPAKKTAKVIGFTYFSRIAAAILIIVCGIWIVYSSHAKTDNASIVTGSSQNTALPSDNNITSPKNNSGKNDLITASVNKRRNNKTGSFENGKKTIVFGAINSKSKLIDNDILLTLVSYKYNEYLPLLYEIKRNNKIRLDEFSYVTISDKMNSLLKKMYATNRKNKPTRRAKRLLAKITKWKKADEKYFDTNPGNNPLDIIDLSEFILK